MKPTVCGAARSEGMGAMMTSADRLEAAGARETLPPSSLGTTGRGGGEEGRGERGEG